MNTSGATSRNIIAVPFAFDEKMNTGANIQKETAFKAYLQGICVAAASAKAHNPQCTVAVITNLSEDMIPKEYREALRLHGVEIIIKPYDRFRFPADYKWSLAFYKICALSYLIETNYDNICYFDADVFVQGSLDNAWKDSSNNLLLFDTKHGKKPVEDPFAKEIKDFLKVDNTDGFKHYGGEFFMANNADAKQFVAYAQDVYKRMIDSGFRTVRGDEFILCLAGKQMEERIQYAGDYIRRYWTSYNYRMINDTYKTVAILHLPDEKMFGLPYLYEKYIKSGQMPEASVVWKKCRLTGIPFGDKLRKLRTDLMKRK